MKMRVKGAVVDTRQLTLYQEDGTSLTIPQSDPRVRSIIDQVMPVVQSGNIAEIDLDPTEATNGNVYRNYEEKSSGLVRMFRVAKKALGGLFGSNSEPEPAEEPVAEPQAVEVEPGEKAVYGNVPKSAINAIMEQAESVSSETYSDHDTTPEHTMVALVSENDTVVAIPGVENLKEQMAYASRMGSTKGIDNFMRRIARVIGSRPHSIEDLLRFMEKGDLPIADDGCIIAYKILKRAPDDSQVYVDCHTGKVRQRCGSYVVVDHSLVDLNRRNECSNGLHIARRGYIRQFNGDLVTLCKIRPEDVMTVPHGDPNKVRVCGYHILFELTGRAYDILRNNQAATSDSSARDLLNKAVTGRHAPPMEEVRITEQRGGGVVTTRLDGRSIVSMGFRGKSDFNIAAQPEETPSDAVRHQALDAGSDMDKTDIKEIEEKARTAKQAATATPAPTPKLPPKKKLKASAKPKAKAKPKGKKPVSVSAPKPSAGAKKQTVAEQARELFQAGKLTELVAFKKAKKKGWDVLGFTPEEIGGILAATS